MMIIRIQQREANCQYRTFKGHITCLVNEEKKLEKYDRSYQKN